VFLVSGFGPPFERLLYQKGRENLTLLNFGLYYLFLAKTKSIDFSNIHPDTISIVISKLSLTVLV
jgi:hypothetical protein